MTAREPQVLVEDKPDRSRGLLLTCIYLVSFAILIWFFVDGYSYYMSPYTERPHEELYRVLRPAGSRGLLFGYAGAIMMVLMLTYTLRKRTRLIGRSVTLRSLLDFHIYFGVVGPFFIVLHTSFKVQGLVAVSFWSMVAVAASGYFGRYLYQQIPRNLVGAELTLQDVESENTRMTTQIQQRFALDDDTMRRIEHMFERAMVHNHKWALASVMALVFDDIMRPFTKASLRHQLKKIVVLPQGRQSELFDISFRRALLRRRIILLGQVQALFHYWHVIHKPFAIVMYVIMGIHIGVAIWTGYGWIR